MKCQQVKDGIAKKPVKPANATVKKMFLQGKVSAPDVQALCSGITEDEQCVDWGRAGNSGAHPGNSSRDLISKMKKTANRIPLYEFDNVLWDKQTNSQVTDTMHVALLHEEVDDLVKDDPRAYAANDGISDLDKAALGWSKKVHVHANDHLIGGIGIWGDSAVYNTRDSIVLILFNILTGLCATPHRIWLACLSKKQLCQCGCQGRCTLEPLWDLIGWSLRCSLLGFYPTHRHDGVPFAESTRTGDRLRAKWATAKRRFHMVVGVIQQRGDWSWMAATFDLSNWTGVGKKRAICWKCDADKTDCPYTDVSATAKWRSSPSSVDDNLNKNNKTINKHIYQAGFSV